MGGPEFFQTRMGQTFYEGSVPRIVKALERIASMLESRDRTDEPLRKVLLEARAELKQLHDRYYSECLEGCPTLTVIESIDKVLQ